MQANMKQEKEKTDRSLSSLLYYLSGTDQSITNQVPAPDLKTYFWLGLINLFLSLLMVPVMVFLINYIFEFSWIISIAISVVLFLPVLFVLRLICSFHVRYISKKGVFIPLLTFSILFYISIAAMAMIGIRRAIETSSWHPDGNRYSDISQRKLQIADSIYMLTNQYRTTDTTYLDPAQHDARKHFTDSISFERTSSLQVKKLQAEQNNLDAEFSLLQKQFDNYYKKEQIFSLTGAILLLLFFLCIPTIIWLKRNDFYHQLVNENEVLTTKMLEEKRSELLATLKKQNEINLTKQTIAEFSNDLNDASLKETALHLNNANDPRSLEALADVKYGIGAYTEALVYYNDAIKLEPENATLWKKKADTLRSLQKYIESEDALTIYTSLLRKETFIRNLPNKIVMKSLEFNNINFYGSFKWELSSNINILLGKNGYGKSHLLSIIAAVLQADETNLRLFNLLKISTSPLKNSMIEMLLDSVINEEAIKKHTSAIIAKQSQIVELKKNAKQKTAMSPEEINAVVIDPEINKKLAELEDTIEWDFNEIEALRGRNQFSLSGMQCSLGKISTLAIPDIRFINKTTVYTLPVIDDRAKKLVEFGAYHFIEQAPYEQAIQNFLNTVCNIYLDSRNFEDEIFKVISRVFKVLTGNDFTWAEISRSEDNSGFNIKVLTEGSTESLPIQKVSQGTISVLSIFGIIYNYLSQRYPQVKGPELLRQHAIIIIDEIDAHLHPSWQQKIIALFREEFPNIQFIITAHSPLIVAGCKENEVSVLRKQGKEFVIETIQRNLVGLSLSDIFQMIFEIEEKDETYLEISALLSFKDVIEKRYQELGSKTNISSTEKEEFESLAFQVKQLKYTDQVSAARTNKDEYEMSRHISKLQELESAALNAGTNKFKS
jgi:predicted ATP-binding protein involved in virulence